MLVRPPINKKDKNYHLYMTVLSRAQDTWVRPGDADLTSKNSDLDAPRSPGPYSVLLLSEGKRLPENNR